WFRGFSTGEVVSRFSFGPVWDAHREMIERTEIRIDSAYSLRPAVYTSGFTLGEQLTQRAANETVGIVVATIYRFDWRRYQGPMSPFPLVPAMAAAGGRPLAAFETAGWSANPPGAHGERTKGTPGRAVPDNPRIVAFFTWFPDVAAYDRYTE